MSVALSADGQRLASGSNDRTVKLWDTTTGTCIATLEGHSGGITSVALSADGQRLASGSDDGTVELWDTTTGARTATLKVGRPINQLTFGGTGSTLYINSGVLRLDTLSMLSEPSFDADFQAKRSGIGLSDQSNWVVWDSFDVVWLPPAYRGLPAVIGSTLAVGCPSGRVYLLRISPE